MGLLYEGVAVEFWSGVVAKARVTAQPQADQVDVEAADDR
jgi:hypothetical protein